MRIKAETIEDLELLFLFTLDSSQAGLKVHHDAAPERIKSAQRLFDMDLTTLPDGGYLTPLGIQAVEHAQKLLGILDAVTPN